MYRFATAWIMTALLATMLLLSSCSKPTQSSAAKAGADPQDYIPVTSDLVLTFDMVRFASQLDDIDKLEAMKTLKEGNDNFAEVITTLDINLFDDVQYLALGAKINPDNPQDSQGVMVIKSSLELEKLAASIKEKAADTVSVEPFTDQDLKGYKFVQLTSETADAPEDTYLIEREGLLLVGGTINLLHEALFAKSEGATAFKQGPLSQGRELVDRDAQVYLAIDMAPFTKSPDLATVMPGADDMGVMAFSVNYDAPKVDFAGAVQFGTEENAKAVATQIQGFLGLFGADPSMQPVMSKIKITSEANVMKISGSWTEDELEAIAAKQQQIFAPGMNQ